MGWVIDEFEMPKTESKSRIVPLQSNIQMPKDQRRGVCTSEGYLP